MDNGEKKKQLKVKNISNLTRLVSESVPIVKAFTITQVCSFKLIKDEIMQMGYWKILFHSVEKQIQATT